MRTSSIGDMEQIVARSEARDSSGCAWSPERREFSRDHLNVTLSEPTLNRQVKAGKDATERLQPENRCWFRFGFGSSGT